MIKFENECVGCPPEMGCLGNTCPNRNVLRFYCDNCRKEDTIYYFNGQELCIDCILNMLQVGESEEYDTYLFCGEELTEDEIIDRLEEVDYGD